MAIIVNNVMVGFNSAALFDWLSRFPSGHPSLSLPPAWSCQQAAQSGHQRDLLIILNVTYFFHTGQTRGLLPCNKQIRAGFLKARLG